MLIYDNHVGYITNSFLTRCVRVIVIEEVRRYGKIIFIKNIVEKDWGGEGCIWHIPLDQPLQAVSFAQRPSHAGKQLMRRPCLFTFVKGIYSGIVLIEECY